MLKNDFNFMSFYQLENKLIQLFLIKSSNKNFYLYSKHCSDKAFCESNIPLFNNFIFIMFIVTL